MNRREEVSGLIKQLSKTMTFEEIALKLEVSYSTVYAWSKGSRRPPNIIRKALEKMIRKEA
jgi:DNA-binding transcriptional regulator YiaG